MENEISDYDLATRKLIGDEYDTIENSLRNEAAKASAFCHGTNEKEKEPSPLHSRFWIFVPKRIIDDGTDKYNAADVAITYISRKTLIPKNRIHNLQLYSSESKYMNVYCFTLDFVHYYKNYMQEMGRDKRILGDFRFQEDLNEYDGMMGVVGKWRFSGTDQDEKLVSKALGDIADQIRDDEEANITNSENLVRLSEKHMQIQIKMQSEKDGTRMGSFPKIIHQTWKNETVPEEWKLSPEMWKKHHPEYEYRLWTDENNRNFIEERFPWFLETYDGFKYNIQRADAVRYFILYVYGGIYSDLDIEPTRSLDTVLQQYHDQGARIVLMNSENTFLEPLCASNCFMVSVPKHPFWLMMVDSMMKNKKSKLWMGRHAHVMNSTGPVRLKQVLKEYTKNNYDSNEKLRDVLLTDRQLFSPCSVCDKKPCKCRMCYLKFTKGESWTGSDSTVVNFFMCKFRDPYVAIGTTISVIVIIMLIIMISVIFSRSKKFKTTTKMRK